MAALGYVVNLVSASIKGARLIGFGLHLGSFSQWCQIASCAPDKYLTSEHYRGILPSTLVPSARQHFGDNYRYQDNNATPHRARVVTKMEEPERSPDCNPIKHIWDELGRAITSMDNPSQNLDELRQALLDKWAEIPVERLQLLAANMPRRLAAIITTRYITMTSQWARWRLKSPASGLFTQLFIQVQIKENIKAPRHWPLCGEFTGTGEFPAQKASNAENVSIWWRHHVPDPDLAYTKPYQQAASCKQIKFVLPDLPQLPSKDIQVCW